jgi:hypothetical protein
MLRHVGQHGASEKRNVSAIRAMQTKKPEVLGREYGCTSIIRGVDKHSAADRA